MKRRHQNVARVIVARQYSRLIAAWRRESDIPYFTREVRSVKELRRSIRDFSPDVLILDESMRGDSPLDVLLRLRSGGELKGRIIILAMASAARSTVRKALEAGVEFILHKPVLENHLKIRLRQALCMTAPHRTCIQTFPPTKEGSNE